MSRPTILVNGHRPPPLGTAADGEVAIGTTAALTLESTNGITSVVWDFEKVPVGSTAAPTPTTGLNAEATFDLAGEYILTCRSQSGRRDRVVLRVYTAAHDLLITQPDDPAATLHEAVNRTTRAVDTIVATASQTQHVPNTTALRQVAPEANAAAILAGRTTRGDGGGGTFYYDPSDTTTADDGALTIVTTGGRRLKRLYSGPIDVRWFGAKGDGVTDDTTAIQNAIDAAHTIGGGTVFLPAGTYKVTVSGARALYFYSRVTLSGDTKGFGAGTVVTVYGSGAGFQASDTAGITRDVRFVDLTINNNGSRPSGSVGVDFTGVSFSQIERCSFRNHEKAIVGADGGGGAGYYNTIRDCEIASNTYGIHLSAAANAWTIIGGRINGNVTAGLYVTGSVGNSISTTFESNGVGVRFATGAQINTVVSSYFEGNTSGGIIFDSGASGNGESGCLFSNATDYVRDDDGRNGSRSATVPAQPATRTGFASGKNLLINGDFEVDSDGDGMADGLEMTPSVPAGTTLSLDGTVYKTGTKSQKYAISATSLRNLTRIVAVTVGQRYVFTGWVRVNAAGAGKFRFELGTSYVDLTSYHYQVLGSGTSQTDTWEFVRVPFTATATTLYITMECRDGSGTGAAWMDGFKLEHGTVATDDGGDHLLSVARTIGAPLASGSTITPTHPIHKVTGTSTISTITAPAGFAGELVLIPTGAWSTDTAGNIANVITATSHQPVRAVYDPSAGKWYVR